MASAVPVVISLLCSEFHWFSKEWQREQTSTKQKFMTKMKDEITRLKWYEEASRLPKTIFFIIFPSFNFQFL